MCAEAAGGAEAPRPDRGGRRDHREAAQERGGSFLIVLRGEPYAEGDMLPLPDEGEVLIGRAWGEHRPDVAFSSPHVSRRHAVLRLGEERAFIRDHPESSFGTRVNHRRLRRGEWQQLGHLDRISLVRDQVVLAFCSHMRPGETLPVVAELAAPFVLDEAAREAWVYGRRIAVSGKQYALLRLLHRHRGEAVQSDLIRREVWPERETDDAGIPLVDDEEIKALVYAVRQKLAPHEGLVETVWRYGYRLRSEPGRERDG